MYSKNMTPQAIKANSRNAQLSTGPKTAAGKKRSRHNAIKHAILSNEVVLDSPGITESRREYDSLLVHFTQTLRPHGALEEMLVEKIVTIYWRLRRVILVETALMSIRLEDKAAGWDDDALEMAHDNELKRSIAERYKEIHGLIILASHPAYTQQIIGMFEELQGNLHNDLKKFTAMAPDMLSKIYGSEGYSSSDLSELVGELVESSRLGGKRSKKFKECLQKLAQRLHQEKSDLLESIEQGKKAAERKYRREALLASLPDADYLQKLQRYEAHLDRMLHKAIGQLERCQRLRGGEFVPPPAALNVNLEMGN